MGVNQCVLYSVLTANIDLNTGSAKTILPSVIKNINKLTWVLVKYSKSKSGQQYYLEGIEIVVSRHSIFLDILPKILQNLYDKDVLTDDKFCSTSSTRRRPSPPCTRSSLARRSTSSSPRLSCNF